MWATVLSAIAILVAAANFFYTQWKTDRREIEQWRREELLKLTSSLVELSYARHVDLGNEYERRTMWGAGSGARTSSFEQTRRMQLIVVQIGILNDSVAEAAGKLVELHITKERDRQYTENPVDDIGQLMVDESALLGGHAALVKSFRELTEGRRRWWMLWKSRRPALPRGRFDPP
ncbi:hypothetical protein ACIO52_04635 [Nocardia sp. NPDC087230]|uniref:hypothetical protein n=1 Tax=Nocardia sp. NPDC087230 TaxID=3364331 RepID=UPI0037F9D596